MKKGDLVRYKAGRPILNDGPVGIVVDQVSPESDYHHKIRVMWVGEKLPVQSQALSVSGNKITTWVSPKYFEVLASTLKIEES
jgi:aromatic ring-cleaving dioxygenase